MIAFVDSGDRDGKLQVFQLVQTHIDGILQAIG